VKTIITLSEDCGGWQYELMLRKLEPGERRRNGDFWWNGYRLQQLTHLRWWHRKRIPNTGYAEHYRAI